MDDPDPDIDPVGSASIEVPEFANDEVHSALTPAGQIESYGTFARALGPRRLKIAIGLVGGLAMLALAIDEFN
jgi:hypothetical protein